MWKTSRANADGLFRFTWHWHLAGAAQVIEPVARFLVGQRREQNLPASSKLALLQRLNSLRGSECLMSV